MANLPSQHPTLSLHLTDLTLTPLITSSSSQSHLESLTSLTSSAITSQTAAQRANLGKPQRIMVEYPDSGPVVLQSYLDPRESAGGGGDSGGEAAATNDHDHDHDHDEARPDDAAAEAPVLIGIVVASSSDDAREARRAASRLERVGREFQREWAAQGMEQGAEGSDTSE